MPESRILIVEDNLIVRAHLKVIVERLGYHVCGLAASADQAVALADSTRPDAILMDVRLGGARDGVDAALDICESRAVPVIYVTGSNEPQTLERIESDHPSGVLIKPVVPDQLGQVLRQVCG